MSDVKNTCVRPNYGALPCPPASNSQQQGEEATSDIGYSDEEEDYLHTRYHEYLSDDNDDDDDAGEWGDQVKGCNGSRAEHCVIVTVFPEVAYESDDVLLEAETDIDRPEGVSNNQGITQSLRRKTCSKRPSISSGSQHTSKVIDTSISSH